MVRVQVRFFFFLVSQSYSLWENSLNDINDVYIFLYTEKTSIKKIFLTDLFVERIMGSFGKEAEKMIGKRHRRDILGVLAKFCSQPQVFICDNSQSCIFVFCTFHYLCYSKNVFKTKKIVFAHISKLGFEMCAYSKQESSIFIFFNSCIG